MASREMLECRIYMAEDAMYRRSDELNRHLHELESRLKSLTSAVHHELCESGRTPLEEMSYRIVQAIESFESGTDLGQIRAEADRVTSLKGLIDSCERQVADMAGGPGGSPSDRPFIEALATAS